MPAQRVYCAGCASRISKSCATLAFTCVSFFSAGRKPALPPANFTAARVLKTHRATVTVNTGTAESTILHGATAELTSRRTAVLGLNGSRKSTFLRLFNGLAQLSSGDATVHGISVPDHLHEVRKHVGMLFANPAAQLIMPTAVEDVELSLQHIKNKRARRTAALNALAERGVEHRAFDSVHSLSSGEKQLVALAAVLAADPQVLLLDEPTTLLDLRHKTALIRLLKTLPQQLVIATHDLELAATCDAAVVIHDGRIIAQGPATSIISAYKSWCATDFPTAPGGNHEHQQ
ncbi:energy-coupling factor ABC transporter ATP-binding protein [Canibacter sp. lx-72]|nr:energy-coupling factor ABC transporter ATP-binding protein [Canibacter zhuwentaonis]